MCKSKVLVIKHGALGDFVNSLRVMSALKKRHPDSYFVLITQSFLKKLAEKTGFFDEIVIDNRTYSPKDWWRVVKKTLADIPYEYIYDLQTNNRTLKRYAPLARFATRNEMKWAVRVEGGFDVYSTPAKRAFSYKRPKLEHITLELEAPDLSFIHGEGKFFHLLPERYALLIPGCSANNRQKRWPPARYRELSLWLGAKGIKSVVLGTNSESAEIGAITKDNPNAVDFMGKSEIADIPDIASRALVIIGNDTGPTHIARRVNTPSVICFTEFDASRAAPKGDKLVTSLVGKKIEDIQLEEVKRAVAAALGERENG